MNFKLIVHVIAAYHLVMEKSPSCKFWQWLDEDEGRTDGRSSYRRKPEESYNLTLKFCTLENEINIYRMKTEQENNTNLVNRQELDKVKWKLFTHKVALILLFVLYVSFFSFLVEFEMLVLLAYAPLPLDLELHIVLGHPVQLDLEVQQVLHLLYLHLVLELQLHPGLHHFELQLQPVLQL
uniref:Uncharacterized protein n=1 Tax=Lactuca sativa TaxID=4236 RepID=A0A9R1XQS2_LACSA|nr:hypothetical protein LSAT_V11C200080610 [Lactuca sativa]